MPVFEKNMEVLMFVIKHELARNIPQIKIVLLADWHFGASECNLGVIKKQVAQLDDKNTYGIVMGDLIDNATSSSVGDTYEATASPMEQLKAIKEILLPYKAKILGGVRGNHCGRTHKTDGIDLMYFLFSELGIEGRYNPNAVLIFLRFGEINNHKTGGTRICYTIYASHGNSGGRLPGAKANALKRMGRVVNSDICVLAHSHLPLGFRDKSYEINYGNSSVSEKETLYVNASSALEYGGYAERSQLPPMSMKYPVVLLSGTKKEMNAII